MLTSGFVRVGIIERVVFRSPLYWTISTVPLAFSALHQHWRACQGVFGLKCPLMLALRAPRGGPTGQREKYIGELPIEVFALKHCPFVSMNKCA